MSYDKPHPRDQHIAYFNSLNAAIEIVLKYRIECSPEGKPLERYLSTKQEIIEWRDFFYEEYLKFWKENIRYTPSISPETKKKVKTWAEKKDEEEKGIEHQVDILKEDELKEE